MDTELHELSGRRGSSRPKSVVKAQVSRRSFHAKNPIARAASKGIQMRLLAAAVACLVWTTPAGVSATENAIEEQGAGEPLSEAYERGDEEKAPRVASVALLALPVPALLEKMNSLQRQFFQAVLPESWAIPRYDMAVDGELPKVRKWIQEATDALAAPSVSATFTRIQGHLSGEALDEDFQEALKELPPTPPFLMELLRVSPLAQKTSAASTEEEALLPLPTVDVTRVEALAKTFSPQKLEWPVEKEGVSLFLPVIAPLQRTAEQLEAQLKRLLQDRSADLEELLLPLTGPTGDLLFAKLKAVFKGVSLPEAVSVVPIALIENLQAGSLDAPAASCPARMASENRAREEGAAISSFVVLQASDLSSLWSAVKLPILNKELLLLGRDAPALWGPSMGLASLPRVSLALEGVPLHTAEQQKRPSLAALLQRASATVKSQVYRGSLSKVEESASGEELSDLSFLNFSLPVIGEDTQGLLLRKARRALRLMREFEELWFCLCGFQLAAVARTLAPLIFSTKGDVPGEDCSSAEKGVSCELSWGSPSDAATASESALKPALVKAPFSLSQEGILRLFAKVEALAAALASAVADLQSRIDDVLQSQLSVSAAVPAEVLSEAVSAARRGVGAATAVAASLRRQLSLAKIRLQDALGASQLLRLPSIDKKAAASEGDSQSLNEAPKAPLQEQEKEEEGLLAKRRRRLAPADQVRGRGPTFESSLRPLSPALARLTFLRKGVLVEPPPPSAEGVRPFLKGSYRRGISRCVDFFF